MQERAEGGGQSGHDWADAGIRITGLGERSSQRRHVVEKDLLIIFIILKGEPNNISPFSPIYFPIRKRGD